MEVDIITEEDIAVAVACGFSPVPEALEEVWAEAAAVEVLEDSEEAALVAVAQAGIGKYKGTRDKGEGIREEGKGRRG